MTKKNPTRRAFIVGATGTAFAAAGCLGSDLDEKYYYDEETLQPDADLLGEEWMRLEDDDEKHTFVTEDETQAIIIDVNLVDPGNSDEIDDSFDEISDEFLITGEEVDIGDRALYDEVDGISALVVRDRNAIAFVGGGQLVGFGYEPDRMTVLEVASDLVEYWRDEGE